MHNRPSDAPSVRIRTATSLPTVGEPGSDFTARSADRASTDGMVVPSGSSAGPVPAEVNSDAGSADSEPGIPEDIPEDFARGPGGAEPPFLEKAKVRETSAPNEQVVARENVSVSTENEADTDPKNSSIRTQKRSEIEAAVHSALHRKVVGLPEAVPAAKGVRVQQRKAAVPVGAVSGRSARPKSGATRGVAIVACSLIATAIFTWLARGGDLPLIRPSTGDLPVKSDNSEIPHSPSATATTPIDVKSRSNYHH